MKKITLLFLGFVLAAVARSQEAAETEKSIPDDQPAKIAGLTYSAIRSPLGKESWPDLRSFNIAKVVGENVSGISKTEATVGPGQCSVTVEVRTSQHGSATLTLNFVAEAGSTYQVRPVYRGKGIQATILNADTGEMVARTWSLAKKHKPAPEANALVDAP